MNGQIPKVAISLPTNTDLNSYTTPGFYYASTNATAQTMTNTPWGTGTSANAVSFSMEVVKHAGVTQILRTYNTSGYEFQRQYYDGTWGAWVRMARITDTPNDPTKLPLAGGQMTGVIKSPNIRGRWIDIIVNSRSTLLYDARAGAGIGIHGLLSWITKEHGAYSLAHHNNSAESAYDETHLTYFTKEQVDSGTNGLNSLLKIANGEITFTKIFKVLNKTSAATNDGTLAATEAQVYLKADKSHTHDDRYYTETEIDTKLGTIQASINTLINDFNDLLDKINRWQ
jgi:hypothetical protein